MDEETLKSRATGLVLLCIGIVIMYGNYSMRENNGEYYLELAALGPFITGFSLILVVEAPKLPFSELSLFGWLCVIGGLGVGIWNAFL